ncbi:hypothetical protein AYO20_06978 [Fonsecaea nubica]|uniref:SnoaL-like domain-containing protein n=2 Tax=Fonsecaea TaxID=40354 RepID=A0A0D2GUG6_9EURO|nr:uncharacterized protein Z517_05272 [Fonsecaea pedrosoi CBS 271.37]XP_022498814.1 hypothetical protein AYO20_06978 [Fonsecaea nubica]KIW82245.1 hypothetical protein Z517_05272 [Fonsecaea pedrosoi CBS 271.37]OAL33802.1 hypothetical protein AYO20_06978 [Fonsecaea nubica]
MSLREQLLATAKRYLDAHNQRDFPTIAACCTPSCTHRGGPSSVKGPTRNNDEYVAFNVEVFKMMHTYHAEMTEAIVDETTRKVALFLHAKATADAGEYDNEYIITLTMSEDGKLVDDQYDFIDSHTMMQWIAKLGNFGQETWEKK